jgi:succinate dehydrogenase/fumarate reductase flavoprotein subunit
LPEIAALGLECGPEWPAGRALMWEAMGPARDHATLLRAAHALRSLRAHLPSGCWLLRQRLLLALAMVRAAVERRESRGAHWRRDYPRRNAMRDGPRAVHAWS